MNFSIARRNTISLILGKIGSLQNDTLNSGTNLQKNLADIRFRPELMPQPTEINPVPLLKQLSNTALKRLFVNYENSRDRVGDGFPEHSV